MSLDQFYDPEVDLSTVNDRANFSYPLLLSQLLPHVLNCPYCLWSSHTINDFTIWQEGVRVKQLRCPDCKNTFKRKTLIKTSKMNLKEFAFWFYWVKKYDMDRKIKWDRFFDRMRPYSIFWEYYREIKKADLERMQEAGIRPARDYTVVDSGESTERNPEDFVI